MPKHLATPQFLDFQFYDSQRLDELFAKRRDWWHRYQVGRTKPCTLNPKP